MGENEDVIAYGLDYLRFKIFSDNDLVHIGSRLHYVDISQQFYHGERFVDLPGAQLELIRVVERPDCVAQELSLLYPCSRVDVFVDVSGDLLPSLPNLGTTISNGGKVETVYSAHLAKRGDKPVFGRAYDARAAGHYDRPVTRFEIEYKKQYASKLLVAGLWAKNPVGVALGHIKALFGVALWVENVDAVEFRAITKPLSHSRERFYARYGKGILNDVENHGLQGLHRFIMECVSQGQGAEGETQDS